MFPTIPKPTVALPRLSIAGMMLAFVLSATVATFVGVAAWSLGTSGGPSAASIRAAAYQQGMTAGVARGKAEASQQLKNHAYAAGRRNGYRAGLKKGLRRGRVAGLTTGRRNGYASGYAAGLSTGRVQGAASVQTSSKPHKHSH